MRGADDYTRSPLLACGVMVLWLLACAASGATDAATGQRELIVYAVPHTAQFMNHADDRVRGMTINPFNVNLKRLQVVLATNGQEKGNGPFPGDDVLYTFKLYTDRTLRQSAGSAIFTCYYGFSRRATCDSYFDLQNGLVLASGQIVFNSKQFTLGVSGGTSTYLGASGEATAAPVGKDALRVALVLLGLIR